eukprot:Tamp_06486.p1 GENE.Tamp_06486~~Tamp_06486.p1  ORF type:complete len:311 (-),score=39.69 Tamp_06486:1242-2174(-)
MAPKVAKDKSTLVLEERAKRLDLQQLEASPLTPPLLTPALKHDDGSSGSVRVWWIQKGKLVPLSSAGLLGEEGSSAAQPLWLHSNRCYLLHYQFCPGVDRSQTRHVLYVWHGRASPRADRASATMSMNEVSANGGGGGHEDRQVVVEGKESKHFVIAAGRLMLTSSAQSSPPSPVRMWQIVDMGAGSASSPTSTASSSSAGGYSNNSNGPVGKALEIAPAPSALYSGACFLVLDARAVSVGGNMTGGQKVGYLWRGRFAREGALELALLAAQRLLGVEASHVGRLLHVLQEGSPCEALQGGDSGNGCDGA